MGFCHIFSLASDVLKNTKAPLGFFPLYFGQLNSFVKAIRNHPAITSHNNNIPLIWILWFLEQLLLLVKTDQKRCRYSSRHLEYNFTVLWLKGIITLTGRMPVRWAAAGQMVIRAETKSVKMFDKINHRWRKTEKVVWHKQCTLTLLANRGQ